MIQLGGLRAQAHLNVAQARSVGELGKRHASVLVRAPKRFDFVIAIVSLYAAMKMMPRQMLHDLGENQLACVHTSDRPVAGERPDRAGSAWKVQVENASARQKL